MNKDSDVSIEIAWLHYVSGLTQAEIAKQRGLSKATVHRLLRSAHESGGVCVFVGERPDEVVELEHKIIQTFGLKACRLVPSVVKGKEAIEAGVASLAVQALLNQLESKKKPVIGLGAGRTLAAMARAFPRAPHPEAEFVSLTGDFSVFRVGHSTNVLRRLGEMTGGTGYSIAAPILANNESDRDILISQEGTRIAFRKIAEAEQTLAGIGHFGKNSFMTAFNLISDDELGELSDKGVIADFCGNLLNAEGELVDCAITRRMVSCELKALEGKENTAVAYGLDKVPAILASIKTSLVSCLISDFQTAKNLLSSH